MSHAVAPPAAPSPRFTAAVPPPPRAAAKKVPPPLLVTRLPPAAAPAVDHILPQNPELLRKVIPAAVLLPPG